MSIKIFFLLLIYLQISLTSIINLEGKLENTVKDAVSFLFKAPIPEIPKYDRKLKPKLSIVIPIFNKENYIKNIIWSIQYQSLKELEIIFIDDKSTDKSVSQILQHRKEDQRIRIIKNKKYRGTLYNKIYGGLQSKGEYVTFINAEDLYANPEILEMAYNSCIENDLDVLEFDYFGGGYNFDTNEFRDTYLFTKDEKSLYNTILYQPEIKKNFFFEKNNANLISGVLFNKLYKREMIDKIADYIGEDFWTQIYKHDGDFLITSAMVRNAEKYMILDYGGVYHLYENPDEMTRGVFEIGKNELKFPEKNNKIFGDYISMWERIYDLTDKESDAQYFRLQFIYLLNEPEYRKAFAQTFHFERIINLCERMYNWKYISKQGKKIVKELALDTIQSEIPVRKKYNGFYDGNNFEFENDEEDKITKKISQKGKKNKENIFDNEEKKEEESYKKDKKEKINTYNDKKEVKKEKKKKDKKEEIEEIDGYYEFDDL